MGDLTPHELTQVHEFIDATIKAAKDAKRQTKTKARGRRR